MFRSSPAVRRIAFAAFVATVCLALLAPAVSSAAGVAFLPGATREAAPVGGSDLSVLVRELPEGLLVTDRLAPGAGNRFGTPFTAKSAGSEWYLIQPKGHRHPAAEIEAQLEGIAHIHLATGSAWVIEVPAENLRDFAHLDLCRERLPLEAPPAGWDRVRSRPVMPSAAKDAAQKAAFVDMVSQPAIFQTIQEISGAALFWHNGVLQTVNNRHISSAKHTLAADYMAAKLVALGYTVTFESFTQGGYACRNVVATKLGTVTPSEYVIVGGHYDSISQNTASSAPGAEDNGSGTALVMELARIAAPRDFERSLQFVLFDAEEQGLIGSQRFVNTAVAQGRDIVAAIIHDMVAYYSANYAMRIEGETPWEWLMTIMAGNVDTYTDIGRQKDYYSWGSDHVPFQDAGIPAFLSIDYDYDSYAPYHRMNDTWTAIAGTAPIATQIARADAATLADVAGLLPDYVAGAGDVPTGARPVLSAAPNPFNPRVEISFSLREAANAARLAVYDLAGRQVRELAGGSLDAGAHAFTWDGLDDAGRSQASGSYVCRLELGNTDAPASVKLNLVR
ncbi:MAG: M28 family peptidase [bacterium]|nr:M28 family peptidase [bacterium]